ncbi:17858_t:CDS:2 [Cetraspora pellucida]|uniref:17858_t:CDS:1 n=1 Tax=Cetraspora pellucida TaxID=1433469 RepID=A0ACA9KU83_9GLOM|nr:17858_t:CDS:2 [Cetraspora pellucida]
MLTLFLGYVAEDRSFYASLRPQQNQEILHTEMEITSNTLITGESVESVEKDKESEKFDASEFTSFLEVVKSDYQNGGQTLQVALDKFKVRYIAARSKSIS